MRFHILALFLLISSLSVIAQDASYTVIPQSSSSKDSALVMQLTKVDSQFKYLSQKEKDIIQWLNIARMYPKWFIYFRNVENKDRVYTKTLIRTLNTMKPIEKKLVPSKKLWECAYCHATTAGPASYMGHERQNSKCKMDMNGECMYGGTRSPAEIVKRLLIDKGVPSLGHRSSILEPLYKKVGVSIQPFGRKGSKKLTVIDFAY